MHQRIEKSRSPRCGSVVSTAKLATYPLAKKIADSAPKELRGRGLQASCSSQLPRRSREPPAPIWRTRRDRGRYRLRMRGAGRKREIIVRGKIDTGTRLEAAQPAIIIQCIQCRDIARARSV